VDDSSDIALIIGAVIGGLVLLVLVTVIGVIIYKYVNKGAKSTVAPTTDIAGNAGNTHWSNNYANERY